MQTIEEAIADLSRELARLGKRERKLKARQKRTATALRKLRRRRDLVAGMLYEQERAASADRHSQRHAVLDSDGRSDAGAAFLATLKRKGP